MAKVHILNSGKAQPGETVDNISGVLMLSIKTIISEFVDPKTGRVDYGALRKSGEFIAFEAQTRMLRRFPLKSINSKHERMAFFINIYNTLVIHGVAQFGEADTLPRKHRLFRNIRYEIGGHEFSPDDIEHGILRGNAKAPYWPAKQFMPWDERRAFYVKPCDPRIHFAICCGFKSCPPVSFYTPENLDEQLDAAAASYLATSGFKLNKEKKTVSLTRLFQWYWQDFGGRKSVLDFVIAHLDDEPAKKWLQDEERKVNIKWLNWDFSSNAK